MAHLDTEAELAGLVVGLCQDSATYLRLASTISECGLLSDALRAGGKDAAIRSLERESCGIWPGAAPWREKVVRVEYRSGAAEVDVHGDPLLDACFECLSRLPGGGAPWQGSWRANALDGILKALDDGAIILVVEAHSLDEQRDWARLLLKGGCSFVQTHGAASGSREH